MNQHRMPDGPQSIPDSRFIEALTFHQPVLEAYCHANLARREDAWEVLQQTNLKLWEKSAAWNPETEFLPWAFAVARFTMLAFFRDKMRDRLVFDEDVLESMAAETATAASELPERQEALGRCLEKLTAEQRGLLHAHYTDGRPLREIAKASHRSESAVKMTLLRLRHTLADCIQLQLRNSHP
jgi:RNA polymerase sigma-70 factor (ECF subfamily)